MAVLVSAFKIAKSFGAQNLFRDITFSIEEGQKIGLIGPNGAGKSTLLQILANQQTPDAGQLSSSNSLRLGYLEQNPRFKNDDTVLTTILNASPDPEDFENMNFTYELISKLNLENAEAGTDRLISELSGGWKKRVALARELVKRPTLLLMDEPTNHLDLPSIMWLESFIERQSGLAVLTVTHDRLFLQRTCDLIFDLDKRNPDGLIKFDGTYAEFLDFKEATIDAQKTLEKVRKNYLRQETAWLRRGAKARQTKQKARIERAKELSDEVQDLSERNYKKPLSVDFGDIEKGPKRMVVAENISKKINDRWLFKDFSFLIGPKTRVGLLGRNGCGKSTLIRHLIGKQEPDSGTIKIAEQIKFAYFEQQRESLDPNKSVLKTVGSEGDYVYVQGKPVFARSYLAKFNFRNDQMDLPVGKLSGGEQSRLLIAKLMLQTEPVLVLDEPTNDLDIDTLDVLQEALASFPGAVILVSHDRYFMDQVCNQILAFTDNDGELIKFSDFFQWDEWQEANKKNPAQKAGGADSGKKQSKQKLSYKEQRELDQMESVIQKAEAQIEKLQNELALPENSKNFTKLQDLTAQMGSQQKAVEKLYARWQELNNKIK